MMGYKGDQMFEVGYVYAPWIPAWVSPTEFRHDFGMRKGMMSLYGKKTVNTRFYMKSSITV